MKIIFLSLFLIIFYFDLSDANIYVQNKKLFYGGQQIFLSGANIAWVNYANDFGNGAYWGVKTQYQSYIDEVANNGGNVIRVWVHIDGSHLEQNLYNAGYAGALSWQYNEGGQCSDNRSQADQGMQAIQSQTSNGKIRILF